jgi:hypothetical protein
MEVILRLQCNDLLGSRIERETPTGLMMIARVARVTDGFVVDVLTRQEVQSLEDLQGLRVGDCNELQRLTGRTDTTVTMPID